MPGPPPQAAPKDIWVVHCLIGDGIATNEKAAKVLWAAVGERRTVRGRAVRYFLILGKCGTHQSALSARVGVEGKVAAAAAGDDKTFEGVTDNAVRLYKYLVPDYYEEFRLSVHTWVHETLQVLFESEAFPAGDPLAEALRCPRHPR